DQAQYDIGEVDADRPGKGVFARVGFEGLIPPPGDGVPPSPVFVDMDEKGMPIDADADSPMLKVTQGYIRIHQLQGNSNDGPGGEKDVNGGDAVILEIWKVPPPLRTLTISSTNGGSVTEPGEGTFVYDDGTEVKVIATPDKYYYFLKWTGSAVDAGKVANPRSASTTVLVEDDNYDLKANFAAVNVKLTVTSTDGGSVIDPGEGVIVMDSDSQIPLVAEAESHYTFVKWTGSAVDGDFVEDPDSPITRVYVDRDLSLKAHFDINTCTLTISSTSGGSVTTPGEGAMVYDCGSEVNVIATPDDHYHFTGYR
ncbi:MAG: InlB B-repeat-containing protein, partial [Planctomycetota bacterium]